MHVITFYNAKGGVGKTTSALAVASALAVYYRYRVCCIDLDVTQNSLSRLLLPDYQQRKYSVVDGLLGKASFSEVALPSPILQRVKKIGDPDKYTLSICPCKPYEDEKNLNVGSFPAGELAMRDFLKGAEATEGYDFIIIDCPPSMNALTVSALAASDGVLVPYRNDMFSYSGISIMLKESTNIKKAYNKDLTFLGVFFTQDRNVRVNAQIREKLEQSLGDALLKSSISDSIIVTESTFAGVPANLYKPWSNIDVNYRRLTMEILEKLGLPVSKEGKREPAVK